MSSRFAQPLVIYGLLDIGPMAKTAITGCPERGSWPRNPVSFGRRDIGDLPMAFTYGTGAIGDRMLASTAALITGTATRAWVFGAGDGGGEKFCRNPPWATPKPRPHPTTTTPTPKSTTTPPIKSTTTTRR